MSFTTLPHRSIPFFASVIAQAPHRILTASSDFCNMLDLSMMEMQGRSLRLLFGPETDLSAVTSAMTAVLVERNATIPAIKIYGRDGTCHLFDAHCVLHERTGEEACSIMMLFQSIQTQHQSIADSTRRNSARFRYNLIVGLGLHAEIQSTSSNARVAPALCAAPKKPSSVRPGNFSPESDQGDHNGRHQENAGKTALCPESAELPPPTRFRRKPMTAMISAQAPFQILDISEGLSTLLGYTPQQTDMRSISLMFGPETDQRALLCAIKQAAADCQRGAATVPALLVYGRSGTAQPVSVVCTQCPDAISACRLTFQRLKLERPMASSKP
jgi:hypothetical protein